MASCYEYEDDDDDLNDDDLINSINSIGDLKIVDDTPKCCNNCEIIFNDKESCKICNSCGTILEYILDSNPEWNNNYDDNKNDSTRCGIPTSYYCPIASSSTSIALPANSKMRLRHTWGQIPYNERAKLEVHHMIDDKCKNSKFNIYKCIIDGAKSIYDKITKVKRNNEDFIIFRGKNRLGIIAACVYFAAINEGYPCTNQEIAKMFSINTKQLTKGTKKIKEFLLDDDILKNIDSPEPYTFIKSYHAQLNIPKNLIDITIKMCKNINKIDEVSSHQPLSIAAGCVYLVSVHFNLKISKHFIAKTLGISDVTITKIYEENNKIIHIIMDDEKTKNYLINPTPWIEEIIKNNS
jgi:transcription initiation factor TFIIIB Brf1 subunit/transcription initiation factor TFIIB